MSVRLKLSKFLGPGLKPKRIRVKPPELESSVESKFVELCPYWSIKLGGAGERGKLDRMVLLPHGVACFIEFKRPGGKPSKLQARHLQKLRDLGFLAICHDNAKAANAWLRRVASATRDWPSVREERDDARKAV